MIALPTPHLLFLGDVTNPLDAKTAMGLRDWRPDDSLGQYRLPGCAVDLGLPDMDFTAAAAAGVVGPSIKKLACAKFSTPIIEKMSVSPADTRK